MIVIIIGDCGNFISGGLELKYVLLVVDFVFVEVKSWFVVMEVKELLKKYFLKIEVREFLLKIFKYGSKEKMIVVIGLEEMVYFGDCGLFLIILIVYNNYWIFWMFFDDWWFCVIRWVVGVIEKNVKKDFVCKMFVDYEGKKEIEVEVFDIIIYIVDYSWFFD